MEEVEGECPVCGQIGIVEQHCPDPDCTGVIVPMKDFQEYSAPKEEKPESQLDDSLEFGQEEAF